MKPPAVKTEDFDCVDLSWLKREASSVDVKPTTSNCDAKSRVRYFMDGVVITTRRRTGVRYISISASASSRVKSSPLRLKFKQQDIKQNMSLDLPKALVRQAPFKREDEMKPSLNGIKKKEDEDPDIAQLWRNPTIKLEPKIEAMKLDPEFIRSRIEAAGISLIPYHINCDPEIAKTRVSRVFMSRTYGGSSQDTFPRISRSNFERHGLGDFMYPSGDYQPEVPRLPGAPGLWFNIEDGDHDGCVYRLFTRVQKSPAEWLYQGQYKLKRSLSLSRNEWAQLKISVRNAWVKELFNKSWGIGMRIQIYALNYWGRKPTWAEAMDVSERRLFRSVQETDIARALTRGDQSLAIYTLQCVGYDVAFQTDIRAELATYVPNKRKARGGPENANLRTNGRPRKRRRVNKKVASDDESDAVLSDDDHAQDPDLELEYTDGENES